MKIRRIWGIVCLGGLALGLVLAALWFNTPRALDDYSDNFDFSQTVQIMGDATWYVGGDPGQAPEAHMVAMTLEPGDPAFDALMDFLTGLECAPLLDSLLPRTAARHAVIHDGSYHWELRFATPPGPDPGLLALSVLGGKVTLEVTRAGKLERTRWYIDLGEEEQDWVLAFLQEHGQSVDYE